MDTPTACTYRASGQPGGPQNRPVAHRRQRRSARGRISPQGSWHLDGRPPGDLLWLALSASFMSKRVLPGCNLAHAGRKASTYRPWEGNGMIPESAGGCKKVVAPSPVAFADHYPLPQALTGDGIHQVVNAFAEAARRPCEAGFRVIEIHAAHGYLIHQFLSPLSNSRSDLYGGSFENRLFECCARSVRSHTPCLARTGTAVRAYFCHRLGGSGLGYPAVRGTGATTSPLKPLGADLIDCCSWRQCAEDSRRRHPGLHVFCPMHCPHSRSAAGHLPGSCFPRIRTEPVAADTAGFFRASGIGDLSSPDSLQLQRSCTTE